MKNIIFYLFVTIVIISFILPCFASEEQWPRGVKWEKFQTDHFVVLFAEQHRQAGVRIAYLAEAIHTDLAKFLNYTKEDSKPRHVIITDHADVVDQYNPVPSNGKIIALSLRRPHAGGSPVLSVYSQDWLAQQFIYQYTTKLRHKGDKFFRKVLGIPFPDAGFTGWMDKGMAAYMEHHLFATDRRSTYFDMLLRTEVLEDRLSSLAQRAAIGVRQWPGDIGMFEYGYAFLDYLAETYGVEQLAQLNHQQSQRIPLVDRDAFETVYGKSLETLEEEWRVALQRCYQEQIQMIQAHPLTSSTPLSASGYFTHSPVFSPDGEYVYYIEQIPDETPKLIQLHLKDQIGVTVTTGHFSGDFSLSPNGSMLYFCKTQRYKGYYDVSDLYLLELETQKVTRLTKGEHAFDPAIIPDGTAIIYTTSEAGNMQLRELNLNSSERTTLLVTNNYTQIRHPAVSPDGTKLAIQIWKQGGFEDIYVMNRDGSTPVPITRDKAVDTSPAWGLNGKYVFFSSDRTGVFNIFVYSLRDRKLYQVTNVVTGVFDPAVSRDGRSLVVEKYSGVGMDVYRIDLDEFPWKEVPVTTQIHASFSNEYAGTVRQNGSRRYNPLSSLLPKPMPALKEDEEGFMLGLTLSNRDILKHHKYSLSVLYGLKSERVAYKVKYTNAQFYPTIRLFGYDIPKKYDDLFYNTDDKEEKYFERQQGGGIDILTPIYRSYSTTLSLLSGYKYDKLSALTDLYSLKEPWPDEGILSGASVGFLIDRLSSFRYPGEQAGQLLLLKYTRYDDSLGSDFDIDEFTGELDLRVKMPFFRNHLLKLRVAGGLSEGDTLEQGVFQLGGVLFNAPSDILEKPQFHLRGYEENLFAGDRIVVGSIEYDFPLWSPQKTIWGGRIFCDSFTGALFYETGDAWKDDRRDLDLKHSIGGELSLNIGVDYGKLPLSLGIGFATGLDKNIGESTQVYFSFGMGD